MKTYCLDFETLYTDEYSLKKISPAEYILDPRFEVNGCAFKEGVKGVPFWLDGPDLPAFFASLPLPNTQFISHNALFDSCILAWHYGVVPRLTTCTLSLARAMLGHELKSLSLDAVSRHLGLGGKLGAEPGGSSIILSRAKGMNLPALRASGLYDDYVRYALVDVDRCAGIYSRLVHNPEGYKRFPIAELAVMDMVLRCAMQPAFGIDINVLALHLNEVQQAKEQLLSRCNITNRDELMSNDRFADLLRGLGVEPPMKVSPTTGQQAYAFAKQDLAFLDLLEHPNPDVQALMAARLGHKSTIEETRTQRFINISRLTSRMPMPLRYSGAHTHRLSGDWKMNVQNLTRGGKLRRALIAPEKDLQVVTVDASQIEARLSAWFCGSRNLTEAFAAGNDVYSMFASTVFNENITKANPTKRYVGKQAILGLGFGLGWVKFQQRISTDSENQTGTRITLSEEEAKRVVGLYRSTFQEIPAMWRRLTSEVIPAIARGEPMTIGPIVVEREALVLPGLQTLVDNSGDIGTGLRLHYHGLSFDPEGENGGEWTFTYGGKKKRLYGGKLLENIIQALDRVIVMGAALRIQQRIYPYRLQQQGHDENAYIVHAEHVDLVKGILLEEMTRRPQWARTLPLAAECGSGSTYGDAK